MRIQPKILREDRQCLPHKDIEAAIEKGGKSDDFNQYYSFTSRSMEIDSAYHSSAFGIVVRQRADGIVQIMHGE